MGTGRRAPKHAADARPPAGPPVEGGWLTILRSSLTHVFTLLNESESVMSYTRRAASASL